MYLKNLFLIFLLPLTITAQTVVVDSFYSASLKRMKPVTVLVPDRYNKNTRYAVLYLLHGHSGNHSDWTQRSKIRDHIKDLPLIIIMPNAEDSWYINSLADSTMRYEDFMMKDLLHYTRTKYSIDVQRQAIVGLSMGGYGAMVLALRNPGVFRFAGSLSGGLSVPGDYQGRESSTWGKGSLPSFKRAFGLPPLPQSKQYDVFHLCAAKQADTTTYYYLTTGVNDGFVTFLPANRAFADSLRVHKIPYEYHELPGGHTWTFWDREIQPLLKQMRGVMGW